MENISKALIIAGAIMFAMLVIGMSVLAFNIVKNPVARAVDNMSTEERVFFNTKFQRYAGGRVAGIDVKALISISMQNSKLQFDQNEKGRIPEIFFKGNGKTIDITRAKITSETNSDNFASVFQEMLNNTKNPKFFSVVTELNARNGIVSKIMIDELSIK